jgi:hypothetical protein
MAETAMVISFTLIVLFGMLQIILIGYFQVAGDAAVFVAAHEYTLGVTQTTITSAEASMVPRVIATALTFNAATPNPLSNTLFTNVYGVINQTNRNGGFTTVRPQNFQVSLGTTAAYNGVLGFNNMPISSGAVEGYYLMTNDVMDNSGALPNDSTALANSVLNAANASPFEPNTDSAATNMNVPPYYAPIATIQFCADPWYSTTAPWFSNAATKVSVTYDCANPKDLNLGMAEYLDNNNYIQTNMGVGLNGVFQAMASHQRVYANLINAFPATMSDQNLAYVQEMFQWQGSPLVTVPRVGGGCTVTLCGANWSDNTILPNSGTGGTAVPLYYYDPMNCLALSTLCSGYTPSWMTGTGAARTKLWSGNTTASQTIGADPGNDGVLGPAGWGYASPAVVYEWDQPNGPNNQTGPTGLYPLHPLAGTGTSGDPGY